LRQEQDEAARRLVAIQQEEQQQAKSAEPASSPTNSPPPALATPATAEPSTNSLAGLAAMLKNPQMKEMIRAQQKMMVDQMYGNLYKELGLSPTDEEALKKRLEDRQVALMDAGLAAMGGFRDRFEAGRRGHYGAQNAV
jgi:glucose/arabinose dehydrogenase